MADLHLQASDDHVERLAHENDPVRGFLSSLRRRNLVDSRNKFLSRLEHLFFDPRGSNEVGERDHLPRLLERELWIFGEVYHIMNSERGLTEMLRTHLMLEGLLTTRVEPVRRWDGKGGRVDLHLAAKMQEFDLKCRNMRQDLFAVYRRDQRRKRD